MSMTQIDQTVVTSQDSLDLQDMLPICCCRELVKSLAVLNVKKTLFSCVIVSRIL